MEENTILRIIRKYCRLICHQKPNRCFKIKGYLMPICARCTGIIISFVCAVICLVNKLYINKILAIIMTLIMFIDWLIQFLKIKTSTNIRRLVTGLIGGFGMSYVYYYIISYIINLCNSLPLL